MLSIADDLTKVFKKLGVHDVHSFEPSEFLKFKELAKTNAENNLVTALITCTGDTPPTIAPMNFSLLPYIVDVYLIQHEGRHYMVGIYSKNPFVILRGN